MMIDQRIFDSRTLIKFDAFNETEDSASRRRTRSTIIVAWFSRHRPSTGGHGLPQKPPPAPKGLDRPTIDRHAVVLILSIRTRAAIKRKTVSTVSREEERCTVATPHTHTHTQGVCNSSEHNLITVPVNALIEVERSGAAALTPPMGQLNESLARRNDEK